MGHCCHHYSGCMGVFCGTAWCAAQFMEWTRWRGTIGSKQMEVPKASGWLIPIVAFHVSFAVCTFVRCRSAPFGYRMMPPSKSFLELVDNLTIVSWRHLLSCCQWFCVENMFAVLFLFDVHSTSAKPLVAIEVTPTFRYCTCFLFRCCHILFFFCRQQNSGFLCFFHWLFVWLLQRAKEQSKIIV